MHGARIEKPFDINILLMTIYSSLESVREERGIELIYDIEPRVPREMKGDIHSLSHLLTHFLMFLMPYSVYKELVLHVDAPEDFLYQETVRFYLEAPHIDMSYSKIQNFFDTRLHLLLEKLDAKGVIDTEKERIVLEVPLKIKELGNRRHYRLPDIRMVGKKVLLICENRILASSIAKMFRYFLYEVDEGAEAYKKRGSNLAAYDIFVLDANLHNEGIKTLVEQVQRQKDLKFVLIKDAVSDTDKSGSHVSACLIKPVMQESIFELIISLYEEDAKNHTIRMDEDKRIIDMGKYIDSAFEKSEKAYIDMLKKQHSNNELFNEEDTELPEIAIDDRPLEDFAVFDSQAGKLRCKEQRCDFDEELRRFLDKFNRSDYYFREIARGKAIVQIKEFAQDLEKSSLLIGAERMAQLAKRIGLVLVYSKLDELNVFVNKYHVELKKLIVELSNYLKKS